LSVQRASLSQVTRGNVHVVCCIFTIKIYKMLQRYNKTSISNKPVYGKCVCIWAYRIFFAKLNISSYSHAK